MQIVLGDFTTLDGVVQAPDGRDEDTDGVPHAQPGRPHLVGLHLAARRRRDRRGAGAAGTRRT